MLKNKIKNKSNNNSFILLKKNSHSSFTLIELLVVITIIVIIGAIIFASTADARKQARDTQRIQNTKNLAQALELYYSDYWQYPPLPGGNCVSDNNLGVLVQKGYIKNLPQEPLSGRCYIYLTDATGQTFKILAKLEANQDLMKQDSGNQDNFYEVISINGIQDLVYEGGLGGWPEGCFPKGTLVKMADNSLKKIEDIQVQDRVLSFNPITKTKEIGQVTQIIKNPKEKNQDYYILLNNSFKFSPSQILYTNNNQPSQAKDLKLNNTLLSSDNQEIKIFSIKKIQKQVQTYNIKVQPFNNFYISNK